MSTGDHDQTQQQPAGGGHQTGQPPYAGQPPPPAGYPPRYAGYPPPYGLPRHPDAMTALVLGGASMVLFPPLGPFAWYIGAKASREIASAPGRWSGDDLAKIGMVLGVVATALCVLAVLVVVMFLVIGVSVLGGLAAL